MVHPESSAASDPPTEPWTADTDPLLGRVLDQRYRLDARIGKGGMGQVYAAWQLKMKRRVAVKLLFQDLSSDPDFRTRFEREAVALAQLNHENIVHAYDHGITEDGRLYLVTELLSGQPLHELVAAQPDRQMALAPAVSVLEQVAAALEAAHERVVHRDLKPHNIIVGPYGRGIRAKLLDFGIVRPVGGSELTTAGVIGTPAYMSPEQVQQDTTLDARADLYSLGAVAFELLTGRPPFVSDRHIEILTAHLFATVPDIHSLRKDEPVPPALAALVSQLLEKDRANRPQTAFDVRRRLAAIASGLEGSPTLAIQTRFETEAAPPTPVPSKPNRPGGTSVESHFVPPVPKWRKWVLLAPVALVLLAAGLGLQWWLSSPEPVPLLTDKPDPELRAPVSPAPVPAGLELPVGSLAEEPAKAAKAPARAAPGPASLDPAPLGLAAQDSAAPPASAADGPAPAEKGASAPAARPSRPAPKPSRRPAPSPRVAPAPRPASPSPVPPKKKPEPPSEPLVNRPAAEPETSKPRLEPGMGYATVSAATPTGSWVIIEVLYEGKVIGRGVDVKVMLPAGRHQLSVRKAGQPTNLRNRSVTVKSGQDVQARVLLD